MHVWIDRRWRIADGGWRAAKQQARGLGEDAVTATATVTATLGSPVAAPVEAREHRTRRDDARNTQYGQFRAGCADDDIEVRARLDFPTTGDSGVAMLSKLL